MVGYSYRKFVDHPSISAVIACHVAAHHTRPNSTVEEHYKKLEEKFAALGHKQDALESRLAKLGAKNRSTPPRKGGGGKNKDKESTRGLSPGHCFRAHEEGGGGFYHR
jgi:hypothetical protein